MTKSFLNFTLLLASLILNILAKNLQNSQNSLNSVFKIGESNYFVIKAPSLLSLPNGDLLAWGEARIGSSSDHVKTDLVMKRSQDNGKTWTPLQVLFSEDNSVIGNAAPVFLKKSNKILLVFCINNSRIFVSESFDFGQNWATQEITEKAKHPDWSWVSTSSPASLQLSSGRIIIPAYHSHYDSQDGVVSKPYIIYSDDEGETFQIGAETADTIFSIKEHQIVELDNNQLMINAKILMPFRVFGYSYDGGLTYSNFQFRADLVGPLHGSQGSTVKHPLNNWLFFSNPCDWDPKREKLCVQVSKDLGKTWEILNIVYEGRSGSSALQILSDQSVAILYERAPQSSTFDFVPQEIGYQIVWIPDNKNNEI